MLDSEGPESDSEWGVQQTEGEWMMGQDMQVAYSKEQLIIIKYSERYNTLTC